MRIAQAVRLLALLAAGGVSAQTADVPTVRMPSMPDSKIVRKVSPEYPAVAVERRIEGTVRFQVVIGTDGTVERIRTLSGHPLLVRAALRAARQWVFDTSDFGGKPVRFVTSIEVPFRLDAYGRPVEDPPSERTAGRI